MAPVPQAMPLAHAPQSMVLPQLSPTTPQYWPPVGVHDSRLGQLAGDAPHTLVRPAPPQVNGRGAAAAIERAAAAVADHAAVLAAAGDAAGQRRAVGGDADAARTGLAGGARAAVSARPQPSPIVSQYWVVPAMQLRGWQLGPPTQSPPLVPPLMSHMLSPVQAPQSSAWPRQPLPMRPQYVPPGGVQVTVGVHGPASAPLVPATPNEPPSPVAPAPPVIAGRSAPASTADEPPLPPPRPSASP